MLDSPSCTKQAGRRTSMASTVPNLIKSWPSHGSICARVLALVSANELHRDRRIPADARRRIWVHPTLKVRWLEVPHPRLEQETRAEPCWRRWDGAQEQHWVPSTTRVFCNLLPTLSRIPVPDWVNICPRDRMYMHVFRHRHDLDECIELPSRFLSLFGLGLRCLNGLSMTCFP